LLLIKYMARLKRVLIVEDNPSMLRTLTLFLERAGYDVVAVAEFQRALQLIEDELFDKLVTDLDLPGGTGLELVLTASSLRPNMRSVLMTGYSCSAIRKQAGELSLVEYMEKPFDPDELVAVLDVPDEDVH
jgi:DNA-binding NtrC family response regulator